MRTELEPGLVLTGVFSAIPARIESLLGEGGQGAVYRVRSGDRPFALKWYNATMIAADPGLWTRLHKAVDRGAPSDEFLWPFDLVTRGDRGDRFGYLMRLRGERFAKLTALVSGETDATFRAIARACFHLADAFSALHAKGLAYQDISAANIFVEPDSGAIQICDNDNVDIDGTATAIGGTRGYQAPELVLRRARPSRRTDLHALAVLLFEILHRGNPLRGRRESEFPNLNAPEADLTLYGTEPRFVFDPDDPSNRPDPALHGPVAAHWAIYPRTLRDLFTRAFTAGLADPEHGRVLESEWRAAMSQLHDAILRCPSCGAESFYDASRIAARLPTFRCWNERCATALPSTPPRIGIRRTGGRAGEAPAHVVVLEPGARLYAHHATGGDVDFRSIAAEVPDERPLRLANRSGRPWIATHAGTSREVPPGDAIPLASGLRIRFERTEGEVKL